MAAVVARPDRRRQRFKQRLHGLDIGIETVVAGGEIDQIALDAADVAQPQHRASGDGAAGRFERPAGARGERHDKAAAFAAQRRHGLFHALRRGRLQPGAEGQHAFGIAGHDDGGVAENFRPVVSSGPGHQHLRIGQQQLLEAVEPRPAAPGFRPASPGHAVRQCGGCGS